MGLVLSITVGPLNKVGVRVTILKDASRPRPRYIGQRLNGLSHGFGRLTFSDES